MAIKADATFTQKRESNIEMRVLRGGSMANTSKWKQVTKEDFYNFIDSHPTKLGFDTTGICEPPISSYNDFSRGNWPDSMVAKVYRNDMLPKEWNAGENEYYLLTELCQ